MEGQRCRKEWSVWASLNKELTVSNNKNDILWYLKVYEECPIPTAYELKLGKEVTIFYCIFWKACEVAKLTLDFNKSRMKVVISRAGFLNLGILTFGTICSLLWENFLCTVGC